MGDVMRAGIGDEFIVAAGADERDEQVATIVAIQGSDANPAYLVHWVIGDYDALVSPWPGTKIRHKHDPATPPRR
jgi:hypothetical protein